MHSWARTVGRAGHQHGYRNDNRDDRDADGAERDQCLRSAVPGLWRRLIGPYPVGLGFVAVELVRVGLIAIVIPVLVADELVVGFWRLGQLIDAPKGVVLGHPIDVNGPACINVPVWDRSG
jgi:hypothetical protein